MHSRIIQISKEKIDKDDYIEESDYWDNFVGPIADYVSEDTDRDGDIEWFVEILKDSIEYNKDEESFTIKDRKKYFERSYDKFMKILNEISDTMTLDKYMSPCDTVIYSLKSTYDDKFGFYIDDKGEYHGLSTLDNFMRYAEDGQKFYIGGTMDYHS